MNKYFALSLLSVATVAPAFAQETSAGGTQQVQASWSALKTLVEGRMNTFDGQLATANQKLDDIKTCGNKGQVYSPKLGGADGCWDPSSNLDTYINNSYTIQNINATIKNILGCGEQGKIYDQSASGADKCVTVIKPDTYKDCTFTYTNQCPDYASCKIRDVTNKGTVYYDIPKKWKHGQIFTWKIMRTDNNYQTGQCWDGAISRGESGT